MEEKKKINNDEVRRVNLEAIKSIKRHLQKPKKAQNLYYIPDYERGLILCALKNLKNLYFDPDIDVERLNYSVARHVKNVKEGKTDGDMESDCDVAANK